MNKVTLRRLRIDDLDEIQSLCYQQMSLSGDPFNELRISERQYAWEMKRLRQELLTEQRYVAYVALDEEKHIIGFGSAVVTQQARFFSIETYATIGELFVVPEHRNHGVGRNIVEAITDDLRDCGIPWITVHLGGNEREASQFFAKVGFDEGAVEVRKRIE